MGNITELRQGSLNGLRRQIDECLESAYNKGYVDGKKDLFIENSQCRREGFDNGFNKGYDRGYGVGFNEGLENAWEMVRAIFDMNLDRKKKFYGYHFLREIVVNLDVHKAFESYKSYEQAKQEVAEQAEEEIKVGDIVRYATDIDKMIVTRVTNEKIETLDKNGCVESWKKTAALHKWGNENVADKLQALFESSQEIEDE